MNDFEFGPFSFELGGGVGIGLRRVYCSYGTTELSMRSLPDNASRADVLDAFGGDMRARINAFRARSDVLPVLLQNSDGETLASFPAHGGMVEGMVGGIVNDLAQLWLVTSFSPTHCVAVTLPDFARLAAHHQPAPLAWVQEALPAHLLTMDPEQWRAPTSWELRHVVGEGSFTGVTGAKAAALVGVNPQSFRKYTARDGASSRQPISFAMWHLLLARLGVTRVRPAA